MRRAGTGAVRQDGSPPTRSLEPAPPRFPPVYDYDRDDPTFLDELRHSRWSVWRVARWLSRKGYRVAVPQVRERPEPSAMGEYADGGDLFVERDASRERVEVQRRRLTFTSAADFPFPTLIIDPCRKLDRMPALPYAYVILSEDMRSGIMVNARRTRERWQRLRVYMRERGRYRVTYVCPLQLVTFFRFEP